MAGRGEDNSSVSMDEEIEFSLLLQWNTNTTSTEDFANRPSKKAKCPKSIVSDDELPPLTITTSSLVSECLESYSSESDNQIIDEPLPSSPSATRMMNEDFANRPSKKAKCPESIVSDDEMLPPTITTSSLLSECPESISSESDNQINDEPLPSSPSPTKMMNEETVFADDENQKNSTDDEKQPDGPKNILNDITYDYLPQDYTLTDLDESAQCVILDSPKEDILVKIDDIFVKQHYLVCLLDESKWLDDEVISAYICCMKDQLQMQNDAKVYFENPFVTRLLKRGGEIGIDGPNSMTNVVKNYLNCDMIHLPINIKDSHYYLASINVEKFDIQVLDSLCWKFNRADLAITEIITSFRYKLAAILLCWKTNTAPATAMFEESDYSDGDSNDVIMSDSPFDQNQSKDNNSLSVQNKYQSLMSVLSSLSIHELVGGICNYIKSINSSETLQEVWVQSSEP